MSSTRPRTSILDKPLSRGKGEVSLSSFALLFSEVVQYSQSRVFTVPELQARYLTIFNVTINQLLSHTITHLLRILDYMNLAKMLEYVSLICILYVRETQSVKRSLLICYYLLKLHCGRYI